MKSLLPILCLTGIASAQDIAPKDSERDPVLSALLENSDFIEVEDVKMTSKLTDDDFEPVLVTGEPPLDATVVSENELAASDEEPDAPVDPKGVRVKVVGGSSSTFREGEIHLVAPFPAKPLAPAPVGWKLVHPDDVTALSETVRLANGNELTLTIRPHVLVPDADGSNTFALSEPGFDPALGYAQKKTIGSILADSIHDLDSQGDRLGSAAQRLSELLDSLPHQVPPDSASTTTDP